MQYSNNYLGLLILNCKTPLGETGCLGYSYFAGSLSIQFFNSHTHVTDLREPCRARGHSHAHTCDLRDAMPCQRSLCTYPVP